MAGVISVTESTVKPSLMHKHKGFSKCNCCHYYKEQLKKKGSVIDRIKLKK